MDQLTPTVLWEAHGVRDVWVRGGIRATGDLTLDYYCIKRNDAWNQGVPSEVLSATRTIPREFVGQVREVLEAQEGEVKPSDRTELGLTELLKELFRNAPVRNDLNWGIDRLSEFIDMLNSKGIPVLKEPDEFPPPFKTDW